MRYVCMFICIFYFQKCDMYGPVMYVRVVVDEGQLSYREGVVPTSAAMPCLIECMNRRSCCQKNIFSRSLGALVRVSVGGGVRR